MSSTFDIRQDAPNMLRIESLNITLKFTRTSPTTGRVSWNIPSPAAGCTAETQAYDGMLITLDTTPVDGSKLPLNGKVYESDSSADPNIFAGDKLGSSFVVGAFYNDKTTTFMDVVGLKPNTPYYVSGFPVDAQYRYFIEGVFAYSLDYARPSQTATPSQQVAIFFNKDGTHGIKPSDYTSLVPNVKYGFTLSVNSAIPQPAVPLPPSACVTPQQLNFNVIVDGKDGQTFQDLVDEINKQFALLVPGVVISPFAPNTNGFFWDANSHTLYQWNGEENVVIPAYVQNFPPNQVVMGTYWVDTSVSTLVVRRWSGTSWVAQTVIVYNTDPTAPIGDVSIWFDGIVAHRWNGVAWCDAIFFNQPTDPSLSVLPPAGSYWYNPTTKVLFKWDNNLELWVTVMSISSLIDPNTLPTGYFWFDVSINKLFQLNTPDLGWNLQSNVRISETTPTLPGPGTFWYNPTTGILQQWNGSIWVTISSVVFSSVDPLNRTSCDLWWNTTTDQILVWDTINSVWTLATAFFQQVDDPTIAPTIVEGSLWLNSITSVMYIFENGCWKDIQYINLSTNPVAPPSGTIWYNPSANTWQYWNGSGWVVFLPTYSNIDPTTIPVGTFWFNTTNNALNQWNGVAWVNVLYSSTSLAPTKGTKWFDQTTNMLKQWDGTQWIEGIPLAVVEINCNGDLLFSSTMLGSSSFIAIDGRILSSTFSGQQTYTFDTSPGSMWTSIMTLYNMQFGDPQPGSDGDDGIPMTQKLGIGTDGSSDERKSMMNDIRFQLGYPVIDVELTTEQLDHFISKALEEYRQKAGAAYRRGWFFMSIHHETQRYLLNAKNNHFDRIVNINGIFRLTSAFLSSAHGAGVYGQIVLQHLYNMGTFDLLSYHLISDYVEQMEILFAARVTYSWDEQTRELWIHHRFPFSERMVLIDAAVERTEQDIMSNRISKPWIRRYALALSRIALAETRGKYSTLPGAGGQVSLNANDLRQAANDEIAALLKELDDWVADVPEIWGSDSVMILG